MRDLGRAAEASGGKAYALSTPYEKPPPSKGGSTATPRVRRRLATCPQRLPSMHHEPWPDHAEQSHQGLRGPDASEGRAGHGGSLLGVSRPGERSGRARRRSRSRRGRGVGRCPGPSSGDSRSSVHRAASPLYGCSNTPCWASSSEECRASNPHATFCGSRRWVTAVGDPVLGEKAIRTSP